MEKTIDLIYDTALKPELWPELIQQISKDIDMGSATHIDTNQLTRIFGGHFERAVDISARVGDVEEQGEIFESALERHPLPAIVLDSVAGIRKANTRYSDTDSFLAWKECSDHRI